MTLPEENQALREQLAEIGRVVGELRAPRPSCSARTAAACACGACTADRDAALAQIAALAAPPPPPAPVAGPAEPPQPGALLELAQSLQARLQNAEEALDLDELDRMARRHARAPASGFPEALDALADLGQAAPELFLGLDVNLYPSRLRALADRGRAFLALGPVAKHFSDLVLDSAQELGDEAVELLETGWRRLQARAWNPQAWDQHSAPAAVLVGYQARILSEGAHRSEVHKNQEKKSKAQQPDKAAPAPAPGGSQQLLFGALHPPAGPSLVAPAAVAVPPAAAGPQAPPPETSPSAPGPDPAAGPSRTQRRFGRLRPLDLPRLARLLDVPQGQRLLRLRCLLGRPVTMSLLGELPAICLALAEGEVASLGGGEPEPMAQPRQSPCPVCGEGKDQIHACCPCGLMAQGPEEGEIFFGVRKGRHLQTRCRWCRPFSVAAPSQGSTQPSPAASAGRPRPAAGQSRQPHDQVQFIPEGGTQP